jgi:hypothetical protein
MQEVQCRPRGRRGSGAEGSTVPLGGRLECRGTWLLDDALSVEHKESCAASASATIIVPC